MLAKDKKRIQKVILSDKAQNPARLNEVIKADAFNLLNDYLELERENLFVSLDLAEDGSYQITIKAHSDRIRSLGRIL